MDSADVESEGFALPSDLSLEDQYSVAAESYVDSQVSESTSDIVSMDADAIVIDFLGPHHHRCRQSINVGRSRLCRQLFAGKNSRSML